MALADAIAGLFGWRRVVVYDHSVVAAAVQGMTPTDLYRRQPALRAVVSFLADNVAGVPLKCYVREGDADRPRDTESPLALLLSHPGDGMTTFELIRATTADLKLWGQALWYVHPSASAPSGWAIRYVPWSWVTNKETFDGFTPTSYHVVNPYTGIQSDLPADECVRFYGYHPGGAMESASPIEALKDVLSEQISAWEFRNGVWRNGGRVQQWISRPANVEWTPGARDRFAKSWKERFSGKGGTDTGGTPLLEDGMRLETTQLNAREAQWQEATRLAREDVAAVYHVNPSQIWHSESQTYASAKDNARALYADTLANDFALIEQRVNAQLVTMLGMDPRRHYCEFDLSAKLAASFEEQAGVLQSSVGGPWMTRNEARARMNMPALEGGDELIVPLNVTEGGLAAPNDTDPTRPRLNARPVGYVLDGVLYAMPQAGEKSLPAADVRVRPAGGGVPPFGGRAVVRVLSKARPEVEQALSKVLTRFCNRQRDSYIGELAKLGLTDTDLADAIMAIYDERSGTWLHDAIADLYDCARTPMDAAAMRSMALLGSDPEVLDGDAIAELVREVCLAHASAIARQARDDLAESAGTLGNPDARLVRTLVQDTFRTMVEPNVETHASAMAAYVANAGACEGARQSGADCLKEWVTSRQNTRDSHAKMDGQRVGIDDRFSNGARWPHDIGLSAAESCNCRCRIELVSGEDRASGAHLKKVRREAEEGTKSVNLAWQEFKDKKTEERYQETVGKVIRSWSKDGRIIASYYAKPEGKELQAARALADAGHVVEFLNTLGGGQHPDIRVDGVKADFKRIESFDPNKVYVRIGDCAKKADIAVIDLMLDRVQLGDAIAKAKNAINSGIIAEGNVFIIDWHGNITVV